MTENIGENIENGRGSNMAVATTRNGPAAENSIADATVPIKRLLAGS